MSIILFLLVLAQSEQAEQAFRVRQVTAELVYLSIGEGKPPSVGERLHIRKGQAVTAILEVSSVSSRFIACKRISAEQPVAVDDLAYYRPAPPTTPPASSAPEAQTVARAEREAGKTEQVPAPAPQPQRQSSKSRLRGTLALQYFRYDAGGNGNAYSQPTARINLRAENLAGGLVGFELRTRSRYYEQPTGSQKSEWNNIIYKASVRIGRDESRFQYQLGRLVSNTFSGVGYIDGMLVRARLGQHGQVGIFAGAQPDWQRPDGSATLDKYGAYYNYARPFGRSYLNSTWALAGEYQEGEVNREFVFFSNRYDTGRLSLYQSAELDINRDWRSEAAGESLSLTNLFVQAAFRQSDRLSWNLGYDNRQAYYTWDLRNRDEVFFDKLARQGWRAGLQARLFGQMRLNAGVGMQSRDSEDDSRNWFLNLNHPSLFPGGWGLRARLNGFRNGYSEGLNPALDLGKRWGASHQVWLGYSSYQYDYLSTGESRSNSYLRLEGQMSFGKRWFAGCEYEYDTGDDAEGSRLYLDVGMRL